MDIIQRVLTLIRATRKTTFELHVSLYMYASFPIVFIAHDHNNYAQLYLITLINLSDTHHRCKELLEQNGLNVSQTLVLCLRNAFDITIRQTIIRYYRLQQLELRFVL